MSSDFSAIAVLLRNFEGFIRTYPRYSTFRLSRYCLITRSGLCYVGVFDELDTSKRAMVVLSDDAVPSVVIDKGIGVATKEVFDVYWDITSYSEAKSYSSISSMSRGNAWKYDIQTFSQVSELASIPTNNSKIYQELGGGV